VSMMNSGQRASMHPVPWRTLKALFGPENSMDVNACVYPPQYFVAFPKFPRPRATAGPEKRINRRQGDDDSAISKLSQLDWA
jgi:hypothetical protein